MTCVSAGPSKPWVIQEKLRTSVRDTRDAGSTLSMADKRCLHSSQVEVKSVRKMYRWTTRTGAKVLGIFYKSTFDFGVQRRHALIVEGYLATHEDVENHTKAPNINVGTHVWPPLKELWSWEIRRATKRRQKALWVV
jgi:hypothetical protein